jgi:predicted Fe-Mo cluster-binding NifX family protein
MKKGPNLRSRNPNQWRFDMKKIFYLLFTLSILVPVSAGAGDTDSVLIAVSADGKTQSAHVSNLAARCAYYMLFDSKGELLDVIDNPFTEKKGGAGTSAANFLSDKGVTTVVAETFGDKMINSMKTNGMTSFEFKGTVDDAVRAVQKSSEDTY